MIHSYLIAIKELSVAQRKQMFALHETHFPGRRWDDFIEDLSQKDWAILLYSIETKELKGFSTILFYETKFQNELVKIVYSGDTITDPSMWSSPILSQAWIKAVKSIHGLSSQKLYWLLISSGYRTYRLLCTFFRDFYPRYDIKTPEHFEIFMKELADHQFGDLYDSDHGVVRFPNPQILSPELKIIPENRRKNPHISFFEKSNPGHSDGDELVCLTDLSETNMTKAGLRMVATGELPEPVSKLAG
ncbi:hypothetical protein AWQ22_06810 [Picosynechococcus sp. PCC 7117]|nr:hypothetical protein AWQ22_06810 [Picosynechococcus sp. PCC 7117]